MVWHIRRTTQNETSGYQYYQGPNRKSPNGNPEPWGVYGTRETYTSQAKAKAVDAIDWDAPEWTIKAINENAS